MIRSDTTDPRLLTFARRTQEEAIDGGVHQHPRYVLCWCVEGTGTIIVDGATLRGISPGQALLLFPYQQHYFTEFAGAGILWVFVSFAMPAHSFLNPLRSRVAAIDDEAGTRIEHLVHSYHKQDGEVAAHLELLLGHLVRQAGRGPVPTQHAPHGSEDQLARASRFVYRNLNHALRVDEVAREVHLSPSKRSANNERFN